MMNAMWVQAGLGLAVAAGGMAWAVRSPRCSLLDGSVYRGVAHRRSIALTFDDGPSESTPRILELLERHGARSTFFQCGVNARRLAGIAREVVAAGHQVGNHTETHPLLSWKDAVFIEREIGMAQRSIEDSAGVAPELFRAPFGVRWFGLNGVQRRWGLQGVMWSVIGLDWKWPAARVEGRLLSKTAPGGIVCLHDGRLTNKNPDISVTLEALRKVLPVWVDQGFKFETVSQILCKTN
jgi:peptidoglycan-N-acetylglucosamine deacetylase